MIFTYFMIFIIKFIFTRFASIFYINYRLIIWDFWEYYRLFIYTFVHLGEKGTHQTILEPGERNGAYSFARLRLVVSLAFDVFLIHLGVYYIYKVIINIIDSFNQKYILYY